MNQTRTDKIRHELVAENGQSIRQIADKLGVYHRTIRGLCDSQERKGFMHRTKDDKGNVLWWLTDKGFLAVGAKPKPKKVINRKSKMTPMRLKILDFVRQNPDTTSRQLAEAFDIPRSQSSSNLKYLADIEWLKYDKISDRNHYRLADKASDGKKMQPQLVENIASLRLRTTPEEALLGVDYSLHDVPIPKVTFSSPRRRPRAISGVAA